MSFPPYLRAYRSKMLSRANGVEGVAGTRLRYFDHKRYRHSQRRVRSKRKAPLRSLANLVSVDEDRPAVGVERFAATHCPFSPKDLA
jgi:hypothetical protein